MAKTKKSSSKDTSSNTPESFSVAQEGSKDSLVEEGLEPSKRPNEGSTIVPLKSSRKKKVAVVAEQQPSISREQVLQNRLALEAEVTARSAEKTAARAKRMARLDAQLALRLKQKEARKLTLSQKLERAKKHMAKVFPRCPRCKESLMYCYCGDKAGRETN